MGAKPAQSARKMVAKLRPEPKGGLTGTKRTFHSREEAETCMGYGTPSRPETAAPFIHPVVASE